MRIWLVRHADAGVRGRWSADDASRPLSLRGRAQAESIAGQLAGCGSTTVLSSPAVRCLETVAPLAVALGVAVTTDPRLAEGTTPQAASEMLLDYAAEDVVACSHGDVIPAVLYMLQHEGIPLGTPLQCEKGSIWLLEHEQGQFRSGRRLPNR